MFQRSRLRSSKALAGIWELRSSSPKEAPLLLEDSPRASFGLNDKVARYSWAILTKHATPKGTIVRLHVCCGYESWIGWEFALGV